MKGGGISLAEVDNVISAFEEYKNNISNFLDQVADTQDYTKAYKGFDQAIKAYVDSVCETVKNGVIKRIDATTAALRRAKEEYSTQDDTMNADIRGDSSRFTFEGR